MKIIKSKIGGVNYFHIIYYTFLYTILFVVLPFSLHYYKTPINCDILFIILPIFFFPPTIPLLFFYFNSFIELDTENKLIKVRKLIGKYKTINLNGNERYIIRRIKGRVQQTFVYVISDDKVLFSYQNIFISNLDEFEKELNKMGIEELPYDRIILFRDLFKMSI